MFMHPETCVARTPTRCQCARNGFRRTPSFATSTAARRRRACDATRVLVRSTRWTRGTSIVLSHLLHNRTQTKVSGRPWPLDTVAFETSTSSLLFKETGLFSNKLLHTGTKTPTKCNLTFLVTGTRASSSQSRTRPSCQHPDTQRLQTVTSQSHQRVARRSSHRCFFTKWFFVFNKILLTPKGRTRKRIED